MLFADLALAQRVEAAEARAARDFVATYARLYPASQAAVLELGAACAAFAGHGSPLTHAVGLGLAGPIAAGDLDCVESFYRQRGSAVELVVAPHADASLIELLAARGYRLKEFENVLARPLGADAEVREEPRDLRVVRAEPEDAGLWARTAGLGFFETCAADPELFRLFEATLHLPSAVCLLAYLDGQAAGSAVMTFHEGVASLYGTSTLAEFRNRGIQTALLRHRLAIAAAAGCDLAVVTTRPGTTSQRNAERQGFRVAYTRAVFKIRGQATQSPIEVA